MKTAEQIGRDLAYPLTEHNADGSYYADHGGITKRQYYKAAAMQGIFANPERGGGHIQECARFAGAVADAMLAEDAEFEAKRASTTAGKEES